MLYGLLVTLFVFVCFCLVLIILVQSGKGNIGLGSLGGGNQMLFGGSGGQDMFQKITWVLGALFLGGSLLLSITRATSVSTLRYAQQSQVEQNQAPR